MEDTFQKGLHLGDKTLDFSTNLRPNINQPQRHYRQNSIETNLTTTFHGIT